MPVSRIREGDVCTELQAAAEQPVTATAQQGGGGARREKIMGWKQGAEVKERLACICRMQLSSTSVLLLHADADNEDGRQRGGADDSGAPGTGAPTSLEYSCGIYPYTHMPPCPRAPGSPLMLEAGQRSSQWQCVKEAQAERDAGAAVCAWDDAFACRHLSEGSEGV